MLNNWREETAKDEKRLDVLERFGAILQYGINERI